MLKNYFSMIDCDSNLIFKIMERIVKAVVKIGDVSAVALSHNLAEKKLKNCPSKNVQDYLKSSIFNRQFSKFRMFQTSENRIINREEALLIVQKSGQMKSFKEMNFMCRFARVFYRKLLFSQMIVFGNK
ncbi:MAG: hypothetical protein N4A44_05115 [Alphaproteobacteria bacterium]|nr:hypothetical protein [Alphaproteobacteria bacterium]